MALTENAARIINDGLRWQKLMRLVGSVKDGSDTTIKLYRDDATNTPFIHTGTGKHERSWYIDHGMFEDVIDSILEAGE
jgi:hypothetical protein